MGWLESMLRIKRNSSTAPVPAAARCLASWKMSGVRKLSPRDAA